MKNIKISRLKKINDLRKISRHDIESRDSAILYINGEIIEAHTHSEAINQYLNNTDSDSIVRYDVYKNTSDTDQLAFAHKDNNLKSIFIETWNIKNIDLNTVVQAIKNKYPNYKIYSDNDDFIEKDDNLNNYERLDLKDEKELHIQNEDFDIPNINNDDDDDDWLNDEIQLDLDPNFDLNLD